MASLIPIGSNKQYQHFAFSDDAFEKAVTFQPLPTDCFVTTPPKTGTTVLQYICHLLRSTSSCDLKRDELFMNASDFEDIYQVAPWAMMAWDLGYDITQKDYNQRCPVSNQAYPMRVFKSHQRLSAMNPGAKYIVTIRDPRSTLMSWWKFLKNNDPPPLRKYTSISDFALDKDFFAENMKFGASLWEYFNEYLQHVKNPNVLVVVFEDLVKDIRGHLPTLSKFLGLNVSDDHLDAIAKLSSKEEMMKNISKFDESWTHERLKTLNRAKEPDCFQPSPRVTSGSDISTLSKETIQFLEDRWKEVIATSTGIRNYEELATIVREEFIKRSI